MPFYQLPTGGSPVLAGQAPPTGGIGNDGDLFIDLANRTLFGPKAGGSWPTGINLSFGPTGATGVTGSTGATGPNITGPTGGIAFSVGPTAPTAPNLTVGGAVWLDQTNGRYFVRYENQFIEIGVQGERGPTGSTGPQSTVTGPAGAASTVTGPTGGIAFAATGPTAPTLTVAGSVWLDTSNGRYFVRYENQFIEIGVQGERGPTGPAFNRGANVQTLATGITLTENSARYHFLTATGSSQTITLPTGMSAGLDFVIEEVDSFFGLQVQTPGAVNVVTVFSTPQLIVWDGSQWRVISYSF